MLVEVRGLEASHGDVKVGLHHRGDVSLVHAEVESLNVVVVRQDPVYFCFHEDVRDDRRQVVRR